MTTNPYKVTGVAALALALAAWLVGCSKSDEPPITRTITLPASKLAEIRAAPEVTVYPKGGPISFARVTGLEADSWPAGVLLVNPDPYLEALGFAHGDIITKIDGNATREMFVPRWKGMRIRRPAGFSAEHYNDLLKAIFLEHNQPSIVLTVYVGVPLSADEVKNYKPTPVRWQIKFER